MSEALVYVQRNPHGDVVALLRRAPTDEEARSGQWEALAPNDPAVQGLSRSLQEADPNHLLAETDTALARVLEDLIDVLIDRGVIQFTDMPGPAQAKLLQRRQTRARLANRLDLLGNDDII